MSSLQIQTILNHIIAGNKSGEKAGDALFPVRASLFLNEANNSPLRIYFL